MSAAFAIEIVAPMNPAARPSSFFDAIRSLAAAIPYDTDTLRLQADPRVLSVATAFAMPPAEVVGEVFCERYSFPRSF